MNRKRETLIYLLGDYISAALAWSLFFIYRKTYIEPQKFGYEIPVEFDDNFYAAVILVPLFWVFIYWVIGSYRSIYRKSRLREFGNTLILSFLGTIILFFLLLLDDEVSSYTDYRYTFFALFGLQLSINATIRILLLSRLKELLKTRKVGFNTILVGSNGKATNLYNELEGKKYSQGYRFVGFVSLEQNGSGTLKGLLPHLGNYPQLPNLIKDHEVEEVLIAIESGEHAKLKNVISLLEGERVKIKVLPDLYDIIAGQVKMNYLFGTALIEISPEIMPSWQKNIKRLIDIIVSLVVLLLLSPFLMFITLLVKISSNGPVFYRQERIGKHGNPFMIYKFRTMIQDAERDGPKLSSENDPRITPAGRLLRKYRMDELPQFYNVLKGDMSLVGPRPERQFFIDKIVEITPLYKHLLKVRPGITSWGMIKFGYAESVEEMIERMKFDVLYIENMSLAMDLKIMFYTVLTIIKGKGK